MLITKQKRTKHNQIACENMIQGVLVPNYITNNRILDAFKLTPKENFVMEQSKNSAYAESSLPLPENQQMLPDLTLAKMLEALNIQPQDKVLQIGTGSGYATAIISQLAQKVTGVELFPKLAKLTEKNLKDLKINNFNIIQADMFNLWDFDSPDTAGQINNKYDKIIFTGSSAKFLDKFTNLLQINSELITIIGQAPVMQVTKITKVSEKKNQVNILFETMVPELINAPKSDPFDF